MELYWGKYVELETTKLRKPKRHLDDIWVVLHILFSVFFLGAIRNLRWLPPQSIGEHGKHVFLLN